MTITFTENYEFDMLTDCLNSLYGFMIFARLNYLLERILMPADFGESLLTDPM